MGSCAKNVTHSLDDPRLRRLVEIGVHRQADDVGGQAFAGGEATEQILDVIDKDVDITMLVLAANPGPEGPGPLITMIAGVVGSFPIPVTIVPGDLSDADIDALS